MSRRPLAFLAAASLLIPGAALAGGPYEPELTIPKPKNRVIDPDKLRIAGVELGMGKNAVQRKWGPAECNTKGCLWRDEDKKLGSGLVQFKRGKAVAATLFAGLKAGKAVFKGPITRIKTKKGIGLGSSVGDLKKAYPDAVKLGNGYYLGPDGPAYSLFLVVDRKVTTITINKG